MNKFKAALTTKSNAITFDRELKAIETNQRTVKPIIDKFYDQIYKIHYTTFRKLVLFKSTDWYTKRIKFDPKERQGTYFLFVGDDVAKLATDSYRMIMRIKADNSALKPQVLKEYPVASWLSTEAQNRIMSQAISVMFLDVIQVISQDRCFLFYCSEYHGRERLKVQYYFRTRTLNFNVEQ